MSPIEHITKVKFLGDGKLQIAYELMNGDEFDVKYAEAPRRSFAEAMATLVDPCLRLLELPGSYAVGVRATGVSLSYTDGIMGAVVTMQKPIRGANAPVIFNTPHLPESPYSDGNDMEPTLPLEMLHALTAVQQEAKLYIGGTRAQMDMFRGDGGEAPKDEPRAPVQDADEGDTLNMFGTEIEGLVRQLGVPVEEGAPA